MLEGVSGPPNVQPDTKGDKSALDICLNLVVLPEVYCQAGERPTLATPPNNRTLLSLPRQAGGRARGCVNPRETQPGLETKGEYVIALGNAANIFSI